MLAWLRFFLEFNPFIVSAMIAYFDTASIAEITGFSYDAFTVIAGTRDTTVCVCSREVMPCEAFEMVSAFLRSSLSDVFSLHRHPGDFILKLLQCKTPLHSRWITLVLLPFPFQRSPLILSVIPPLAFRVVAAIVGISRGVSHVVLPIGASHILVWKTVIRSSVHFIRVHTTALTVVTTISRHSTGISIEETAA